MTALGFYPNRMNIEVRLVTLVLALVVLASPVKAQTSKTPSADTKSVKAAVPKDATVEELFTDFLHYARLGRFQVAESFAEALMARLDLDPVVLLELAQKDKKSIDTLMLIIKHSTIGPSAQRVLDLIQKGEQIKRRDAEQIQTNIERLTGDPQQEFFGIRNLAESGEYAVPVMIQTLLDPAKKELWPRVITALPQVGKRAVNPLVIALNMRNNDVRLNLIKALGEIGYAQAVPYLRRLMVAGDYPAETQAAAAKAIERIEALTGRSHAGSAEDAFFRLSEMYYDEDDTVRSDPRLEEANVWYWDDSLQALKRVPVPQRIFGPVMAMRSGEEALRIKNDHAQAIALWLAANIRRESRLGLNVESGDAGEVATKDPTRPPIFPRALYFTQTAGPRYAHLALGRAVRGLDSAVALGTIEALRATAGEASLVGSEDERQPLVQALRFADLVVRTRAALALGAALPKSQFLDSQNVVPVLASALTQSGRQGVLVVDGDSANLNRVAGAVRTKDRDAVAESNFFKTMERARVELPLISGFFLATDIAEPDVNTALARLRSEFVFSKVPVVLLVKPKHSVLAGDIAKGDAYVEVVDAAADDKALNAAFDRAAAKAGQVGLGADLALSLALESARTLRRIAQDGRTVYDYAQAEPALIGALASPSEELQTEAASVLALIRTPTAQRSIAHLALDGANANSLRIAGFDRLTESARNNGNLLEEKQIADLIRIAREDRDLTIRTAASQALGAMNLKTNQASEIIRSYYGG